MGFTVFDSNHWAAPRYPYPAPLDDAQQAVRFVRRHAERLGIRCDRIGSSLLRLKIDLNLNKNLSILDFKKIPYQLESSWYWKSCNVTTYDLNELLVTKLRAFLQRRKIRDLFDLDVGLQHPEAKPELVIGVFLEYAKWETMKASRAVCEQDIAAKLSDPRYGDGIEDVLPAGQRWDRDRAARAVAEQLIARLPGKPWQGESEIEWLGKSPSGPQR